MNSAIQLNARIGLAQRTQKHKGEALLQGGEVAEKVARSGCSSEPLWPFVRRAGEWLARRNTCCFAFIPILRGVNGSCDVNSKPLKRSQRAALSLSATLALGFLLVLPVLALLRIGQSADLRFVLGIVAVVSIVTLLVYWRDKRSAEAGAWRTPESTLHLLEFFGGWPVAFLAQRVFRHKISKPRYQFSFWAIVAAHELVAFDYLRGWSACREVLALVGS